MVPGILIISRGTEDISVLLGLFMLYVKPLPELVSSRVGGWKFYVVVILLTIIGSLQSVAYWHLEAFILFSDSIYF